MLHNVEPFHAWHPMDPVCRDASLSERLVERLTRPVTARDRARAGWHLLDWLGCAIVGRAAPAGQALARAVSAMPDGPCSLAGFDGRGAQATDAAFLHGGLGSVFELDDLHRAALVHPGDTVVPAALAVAQREGASAATLLDALVRGYEAAIVVGRLAGPRHYRHWYSTATAGVFGAAAAAAHLLQLPREATTNALGLAGMQSAGLWQCREEAGVSKQFATAHAARAGVTAADLASTGLTGPRLILEGRHGWLVATGAALEADVDAAFHAATDLAPTDTESSSRTGSGVAPAGTSTAGLRPTTDAADTHTSPWQIHDVSFKPWPACRHVHPAIEAALEWRSRIDPDAIESIEVETYADAIAFADCPEPATDHEARFSLQHAVAVALCRGGFTLADADAATRDDTPVQALRRKVRVRASPRFDMAYPASFGSAVTMHPRPGAQRGASGPAGVMTVVVQAALGDPERPMSADALRSKAATLFEAGGLTSALSRQVIDACLATSASDPAGTATSPSRDGLQAVWQALTLARPSPSPSPSR